MRCFYVLVHGRLNWAANLCAGDIERPPGFYCHRYVLAQNAASAAEAAFRRVRENLGRQTDWLKDGLAKLELEAEEIRKAPIHKILTPDNRGHTFYQADE